jgi:hypothetical protein
MRDKDQVQSPRAAKGAPKPAEVDGNRLIRGAKFRQREMRNAKNQDRQDGQDRQEGETECALSDFLF